MSRDIQKRDERIDELQAFGIRAVPACASGVRVDYAEAFDAME